MSYNSNLDWMENVSIVMQLGLTMSGSVLFCLLLGRWLGDFLGYPSIFSSIFMLLGIVGGANVCYRQIMLITISKNSNSNKETN